MKLTLIQLFTAIILMASCTPKLTRSVSYKKALKELSSYDYKENYMLLPAKHLRNKLYVLNNSDTIYLYHSKLKKLGFKNINTKQIYIYQFDRDGTYERIKCDSLWNVDEVMYSVGYIY